MPVTPKQFEEHLVAVTDRLGTAADALQVLARSLTAPLFYQSASHHNGFRFAKPDGRHFCLLKGARAVSGMYACTHLARSGFAQEIAVIIRTVVECTSHIEYVLLAADQAGQLVPGPQATYVAKYFADFRRDNSNKGVKPRVAQKEVHESVGEWLDQASRNVGPALVGRGTAELMWNIYEINSNYVHARYPEVMDMFGGLPGSFHLRGMGGTPKDDENCAIVDTYTTTVTQTVQHVARHFGFLR